MATIHNDACNRAQQATLDFEAAHPNYCRACGGWHAGRPVHWGPRPEIKGRQRARRVTVRNYEIVET